ncbi:MAG: phage tail protein [Armatimonadetes bacterium]|nr:phage tail protein [Armatimonadota bacterium]
MAEPFLGEIKLVPYNFAPLGWAFCNGQLMAISQNDALFSLIGTTYGGDGQSTFGLPDLRGRVPIHMGTNPIGAVFGTESVTLITTQIPQHAHMLHVSDDAAPLANPSGAFLSRPGSRRLGRGYSATTDSTMLATSVSQTGGNQPHDNMQPYLTLNFVIALEGIYPSRN